MGARLACANAGTGMHAAAVAATCATMLAACSEDAALGPSASDTAYVAVDDFERAALGAAWVAGPGVGIVNLSDLGLVAMAGAITYRTEPDFGTEQSSEAIVAQGIDPIMMLQVFVRRRGDDGARYGFHYNLETAPARWELKYDGVTTPNTVILASGSTYPGPGPGDTLRLEVRDTTIAAGGAARLDAYVNGSLVLTTTDGRPERIATGQPGVVFRTKNVQPVPLPSPVVAWWRGTRLDD